MLENYWVKIPRIFALVTIKHWPLQWEGIGSFFLFLPLNGRKLMHKRNSLDILFFLSLPLSFSLSLYLFISLSLSSSLFHSLFFIILSSPVRGCVSLCECVCVCVKCHVWVLSSKWVFIMQHFPIHFRLHSHALSLTHTLSRTHLHTVFVISYAL